MLADARRIAEMVPMPRLLQSLGFRVNERTRRCPCLIHGGANPTALAWMASGLWRCHSCGAGGDRITLVRAVRSCGFRDAIEFLAALAGVEYQSGKLSRAQTERARALRDRAEQAAWRIRDEILRLRCQSGDNLHRAERLMARLGRDLLGIENEAEREAAWERMARLAPVCTYFLASFAFFNHAENTMLVRFALASPPERRAQILGVAGE